ncbi:hypothetical protein PVL29_004327 [Vitis rotundifolia]|uniref:Uncharacterized protein n=1 Tax=Vitis rotundifolia TaxID=103349 RepID=A0AA39E0A7_VITRO|nr:hypothetical protein PVL29_004327 [Vitis rotundifolia]
MLKNLTPLSTTCCIYRVPQTLQKENREAYTPRVVSIGPVHHGEGHLVAMEEHKLRYLQNFLSKSRKTLADCVEIISREEKRARDCYIESINMSSEEFVKMILLDGCFIVEVILGFSNCHPIKPDDRVYKKPWLFFEVRRDMTLLENQLPFFLLVTLYSLLPLPPGQQNHCCSFLLLSVEFFKDYLQIPEAKSSRDIMIEIVKKTSSTLGEVKHFVDLLILCLQPSSPSPAKPVDFKLVIPTATHLREGGVRFKLHEEDKPLLGIEYSRGVLRIPSLILKEKSESLFRNLIAFEQCHSREHANYITDYIYLMDQLIDTTNDVNLLVRKRIISSHLGDSIAVKNLFNRLLIGAELSRDTFHFSGIYVELSEHLASPWNSWKATLRHDYFCSLWRGASTIAAVILLLLTLLQTIFSAMSLK